MLEASDAKLSTELTQVSIIGVPAGRCNARSCLVDCCLGGGQAALASQAELWLIAFLILNKPHHGWHWEDAREQHRPDAAPPPAHYWHPLGHARLVSWTTFGVPSWSAGQEDHQMQHIQRVLLSPSYLLFLIAATCCYICSCQMFFHPLWQCISLSLYSISQ